MSITVIIIVITVAVSYFSFQNPELKNKLIMNPVRVRNHGEWYRLVTSGFIHADWIHLGLNMFSFYFFGEFVEAVFGYIKGPSGNLIFVAFYILGIILSDLPSIFKHKDNPYYNSLGASGGVSAVVFSSILFSPTADICLYGFICIPGFILGPMYLIYSYVKGKDMSDNINHNAHLYGALFGLVFSFLLEPQVIVSFFEQIGNWSLFN